MPRTIGITLNEDQVAEVKDALKSVQAGCYEQFHKYEGNNKRMQDYYRERIIILDSVLRIIMNTEIDERMNERLGN